jgi:hypothetical protein
MRTTYIVLIVIGALILLGIIMMIPELRRYFHIKKM